MTEERDCHDRGERGDDMTEERGNVVTEEGEYQDRGERECHGRGERGRMSGQRREGMP